MNIIAGISNINEPWDHKNDRPGPLLAKLASKRKARPTSKAPSPQHTGGTPPPALWGKIHGGGACA